jgi:hypothetical protein
MGGYLSGRRKRHSLTSECIELDLQSLRKYKLLTGKKPRAGGDLTFTIESKDVKGKVTRKEHHLSVIVYHEEHSTHLKLLYGVKRPGEEESQSYMHDIPLETTQPNYGGQRYWYRAPCCGRRVRVLYLALYGKCDLPRCRECLGLHYASQMQSYIERHKTYERHLLANYGYAWAEMEYDCLREHYLEITPEIEYLRQRSVLDMRIRMLRRLMSFTRVMLRIHMHNLRSLRNEEDRQMYYDHVVKEHGESYALDLVRLLGISTQMERTARQSSSEVFDDAYQQLVHGIAESLHNDEEEVMDPGTRQALEDATHKHQMNLRYLFVCKEGVEEEMRELEQQKKAA